MTKKRNLALKRRKGRLRKIAGAAFTVLAVLLLIVAGGVVWLRTPWGIDFVFARTVGVLAESGLTLTAGEVEGPLPGRLMIRQAVLADNQGPLVKIGFLEMKLAPLALARGLIHVRLLQVEDPEVIRLPAGSEETEESGPFRLPIGLRIDRAALTGARLHAGALAALGISAPTLHLTAGGSARLEGGLAALDFTAKAREPEAEGDLLTVLIKLEPGSGSSADQLQLSLRLQDRPGGLLATLWNDPAWPGLTLDLAGQGGLDDWPAHLTAASGDSQITADLRFNGVSGKFLSDLVTRPAWQSRLEAAVVPGSRLPVEFRPPDQAALNLTAELAWEAAGQNLKNLTINGEGLDLQGSAGYRPAEGALQAELRLETADNSPWVAGALELTGQRPGDIGGQLSLTARVDRPGPDRPLSGRIGLAGRELRWPTEELSRLLGPDLTLAAELGGGAGRPLTAEISRFQAAGLEISGQAAYHPAERRPQDAFEARLQARVADLAALRPELAGELTLNLTGQGRLEDCTATLDLIGPRLATAQGAINGLAVQLTAAGSLTADLPEAAGSAAAAGPDLTGRLTLAAADSPGGPLTLGADWRFRQSGPSLAAAVSNLAGELAGLTLAGNFDFQRDESPAAETPAPISAGSSLLPPTVPHPVPVPSPARVRLTGDLAADMADWSKLAVLTGQAWSGAPARLRLNLAESSGRQTAFAELDVPEVTLGAGSETVLALRQTNLAFQAHDLFGQPDLDFNLRLGAGAAGPLKWGSGHVQAQARKGSGEFNTRLDRLKMAAMGGGGKDGLQAAGAFDLTAAPVIDLARLDLRLGSAGLKLRPPLKVTMGEHLRIDPVSVTFLPAGKMTAEADLTPGAAKVRADLRQLPYSFIKAVTGAALPPGEIQSLIVALDQDAAGLAGNFALKTRATIKEMRNLKPVLDLTGRLEGGPAPALAVAGTVKGGPGWDAAGKFQARLGLTSGPNGGFPTVSEGAPLSGELQFTGGVAPLWRLAGQPDRSLTGVAQVKASVSGSLPAPQIQGTVYLAGGRYVDQILGLLINDIKLEAHSTPEIPLKAVVSAKDSHGGGLALEATLKDLANPSISAKGRMSRFTPLHRDDLKISISGDFGAEGALSRPTLSSNLTIDQGEVDLAIIQAGGSVPTLEISQGRAPAQAAAGGPRLALKINIPNQFFIRGFGLESEWRGNLRIGGSARRPSLVGTLAPVRGYFEIFSKEFQFTGGEVAFNGGRIPSLNLELTNQGPNITAIIRAGGTAQKPTLTMESRPPLPEEEILAQVLFGKSGTAISRFEALQLAKAVRELANFGQGGGGPGALGAVREGLGLDVLRLGGMENDRERRTSDLSGSLGREMSGSSGRAAGEQSDDLSVEAGKYLSDNVYVGVEHSAVGGAAVRLEVELRPGISLEAKSSTESSQVGLGWKKDY